MTDRWDSIDDFFSHKPFPRFVMKDSMITINEICQWLFDIEKIYGTYLKKCQIYSGTHLSNTNPQGKYFTYDRNGIYGAMTVYLQHYSLITIILSLTWRNVHRCLCITYSFTRHKCLLVPIQYLVIHRHCPLIRSYIAVCKCICTYLHIYVGATFYVYMYTIWILYNVTYFHSRNY